MLLVAIGCSRLPEIFDIAKRQPFVGFGTIDSEILASLIDRIGGTSVSNVQVYFYETG